MTVRARRSPVSGVWLVLEDVSELRRLQRIRAEFIDNLSHELRTPLTTISLLAETASRDAESASPRLRDRISKIEVETGHLTQMVNELLDLSRIESGTAQLLLDDVDLVRVARSTAERLRLFAERQGLRIELDLPDRVSPVRGDEDRLGQVLINLLHNAVKFSPDGGEVVVGVREDEGEIRVWVRDPGSGSTFTFTVPFAPAVASAGQTPPANGASLGSGAPEVWPTDESGSESNAGA